MEVGFYKMKKILLIIAILLLTGCNSESSEEIINTNYMQDSMQFNFRVDKETCVEYIEYDGSYSGNLTPRLNSDGTLKQNEECLKDKID